MRYAELYEELHRYLYLLRGPWIPHVRERESKVVTENKSAEEFLQYE